MSSDPLYMPEERVYLQIPLERQVNTWILFCNLPCDFNVLQIAPRF